MIRLTPNTSSMFLLTFPLAEPPAAELSCAVRPMRTLRKRSGVNRQYPSGQATTVVPDYQPISTFLSFSNGSRESGLVKMSAIWSVVSILMTLISSRPTPGVSGLVR